MDEQAREILYNQLVEMSNINLKYNATAIMDRDAFMSMPEEDVLKYVFDYRDTQTRFESGGKAATYYIEMPNVYLNGKDLSETYLSRFVLSHEVEGNKREPSIVDLGNTNVTINLTDLGYSELTKTDRRADEEIIDLEIADFRGCNLYGLLPDEYQDEDFTGLKKRVTVLGKDRLDERYLKRRKAHHLSPQSKKIADKAYERLLNGESFYRMTGNRDKIDLTDYDMTAVEDLANLCENFCKYNIEISLFTRELKEKILNGVSYKGRLLRQILYQGDMEFVKQNFEKIDKMEYKSYLLVEICRQGEIEFVRQYLKKNVLSGSNKEEVEKQLISQLAEKYLQENYETAKEDFEKLDRYMKSEVIKEMLLFRETKSNIDDEPLDRMINLYLNNEIKEKDFQEKRTVLSSGKLLYEVLNRSKVNEELALKLIKLGLGLNYEEYETPYDASLGCRTNVYTPTLYKAMKIEDDQVRKEIVQAMVEAGVRVEVEKIITYRKYGWLRTKKRESCMAMNKRELRKIVDARKALTPTKSQDKTEKLNESYQQYGRDLKNVPSEKFEVKEKILDVCGATKESMSADSYAYASMFEEDLLYARLMFFKEQNIEIDPEKLEETMTLTAKQFADTYGEKIGINKSESAGVVEYRRNVSKKLKQQYPLPKSKEELRRKLEELTVKKEVE